MTALLPRLSLWAAVVAVAGLVIWGLCERLDAADARATLAEKQLEQTQQREQHKQLVIDALWKNATAIETQRRIAETKRTELSRLASNRLATLKGLQDENAELHEWAATRLPAPVIRLRQHPALTGADAYYQSVRNADPMYATGLKAKE